MLPQPEHKHDIERTTDSAGSTSRQFITMPNVVALKPTIIYFDHPSERYNIMTGCDVNATVTLQYVVVQYTASQQQLVQRRY